jgi:hypothetical protein
MHSEILLVTACVTISRKQYLDRLVALLLNQSLKATTTKYMDTHMYTDLPGQLSLS